MNLFGKFDARKQANRWKRWHRIFDILEDRPAVIENDIDTLSARGLVKRTAKGGRMLEDSHLEKSVEERLGKDPLDKSQIAQLAAKKYVSDGMSSFTDGSTTVLDFTTEPAMPMKQAHGWMAY